MKGLKSAPQLPNGMAERRRLMCDMLIALSPCVVAGVYRFGMRAAMLMLISVISAVVVEYIWQKFVIKTDVQIGDCSAVVTGLILGLSLPVGVSWWMPVVGSFFAILFIKAIFGGIGDNFMNPALSGRAVLLISWASGMNTFYAPVNSLSGAVDGVSAATALATGEEHILNLLIGNIPGSIGEVSKIMILVGLAYLLVRRVISWHVPVSMILGVMVLSALMGQDPLYAVLSGSVMFAAVYMAPDYTSSPRTTAGQLIYGFMCGIIVVVIRTYSKYPEGVTFAILLMNIVTPLIDRSLKAKKEVAA